MRVITYTVAAALALTLGACERSDRVEGNETAATPAAAADLSALNGTWKGDLATLKFEGKPDDFLLQGGTYKCNSCIPPLTVAADGQYHAVADRPYFDSMSVKTVDDRTVAFSRRKGEREVSNNRFQVSADGNVLTNRFRNANTPGSEYEGTTTFRRAGPAPGGAHAISGQWKPEKVGDYTEEALKIAYRIDGNTVTSTAQGQSYTAEIGGPAVPVQNDPGGTTVVVTREGNGLKETYSRGGKEVDVVIVAPSSDGRSVTFTGTDPRDGSTTTWTAIKEG